MDCLPSQYDIYIYMLVFLSLSQKSETNFNPFGSFFYEPKPQYSLNVTTLEKQDFTSPEKEYLFFFLKIIRRLSLKSWEITFPLCKRHVEQPARTTRILVDMPLTCKSVYTPNTPVQKQLQLLSSL